MSAESLYDYENEVLNVLVYEFSDADMVASERKIKNRLARKKLGAFDLARIGLLRQLKNDLQSELHQPEKSPFYQGLKGQYCHFDDFDLPGLVAQMSLRYPQIPRPLLDKFVPFCIFTYYMR